MTFLYKLIVFEKCFFFKEERLLDFLNKEMRIFRIFKSEVMTKNEVISDAGQIWMLLSERKILSVQRIEEMTHYREALICLALGWLVKENKIRLFEKEGMIHAEIIISIPEVYY